MNFFMSTFFFYFPLIVTNRYHMKMTQYYELLLPMIFISAVTMFAFSRGADHGMAAPLSAIAFLVFFPSAILLFHPRILGLNPAHLAAILAGGTLFYIGFTGLEPMLPSLVSRSGPETHRAARWAFITACSFWAASSAGPSPGLLRMSPMTPA